VLHLRHGARAHGFLQFAIAPIFGHFRMHNVLIDRRQFVGQQSVERLYQLVIAFHFNFSFASSKDAGSLRYHGSRHFNAMPQIPNLPNDLGRLSRLADKIYSPSLSVDPMRRPVF
jgi:hypothetical protein